MNLSNIYDGASFLQKQFYNDYLIYLTIFNYLNPDFISRFRLHIMILPILKLILMVLQPFCLNRPDWLVYQVMQATDCNCVRQTVLTQPKIRVQKLQFFSVSQLFTIAMIHNFLAFFFASRNFPLLVFGYFHSFLNLHFPLTLFLTLLFLQHTSQFLAGPFACPQVMSVDSGKAPFKTLHDPPKDIGA